MADRGARRIPQGRVARLTRVAKLGTRLSASLAGAAGRMAVGGGTSAAAEAFHRGAARALRDELAGMKGLPMKAGQLLSFAPHVLPPEHREIYHEALKDLQVLANPVRWSVMEKVLVSELGDTPEEVFARFDREPIAAASIGQVYRATLHDGREVAVKVQYPGIAEAIRSDLKNVDLVKAALSIVLPRVQVDRALRDFADRLHEETDYGCELCNQEEFGAIWRGDPDVIVPACVPELCTDRVLVSELVVGRTFEQVLAETDQTERNRLGRVLFRFLFRSFYVFGLFNADPHPGNYLFCEDGRIAFLDFGCVQRFDTKFLRDSSGVRRALMRGEMEGLREKVVRAWGMPEVMLDEEGWEFMARYLSAGFEAVMRPQFRYDIAHMERLSDLSMEGGFLAARKMFRHGILEADCPGQILLNRINFGFASVMAALEAEGNFVELMDAIDVEREARELATPLQR